MNDGIPNTTTGSKKTRSVSEDNTAVVEAAACTGQTDAERALADTGDMGGGAVETRQIETTWVYFVKALDVDKIKVGITNNIKQRMYCYGTHWPNRIELIGTVRCGSRESALILESRFKVRNKEQNCHGEWFNADEKVLKQVSRYIDWFQGWDSKVESAEWVEQKHLRAEQATQSIFEAVLDFLEIVDPYHRFVMKSAMGSGLHAGLLFLRNPGRKHLEPDYSIKRNKNGRQEITLSI